MAKIHFIHFKARLARCSYLRVFIVAVVALALLAPLPTAGAAAQDPVSTTPARPTGLTATIEAGPSATLTWDDPEDSRITGYKVFQSIGGDGSNVGTCCYIHTVSPDDLESTSTDDEPGTLSWTHEHDPGLFEGHTGNLRWGKHYLYIVRALYGDTKSEPARLKITAEHPPESPNDVQAETGLHPDNYPVDGEPFITLTWTAPSDKGAAISDYHIYRRQTGPRGVEAEPVRIDADEDASTETTHVDNNVTRSYTYEYYVLAVNRLGTSAQENLITTTVTVSKPARPTGLTATIGAGPSAALTWDDPEDSRITGYKVFQSTGGDGSNVGTCCYIHTVSLDDLESTSTDDELGTLSWTHEHDPGLFEGHTGNLRWGKHYLYIVRALYGDTKSEPARLKITAEIGGL